MTNWRPTLEMDTGPKYRALADALQRDVYAGHLKPGERLPTHRELADLLDLNVSTVTRGYLEAEKRGLIAGTVGRGTFVASDVRTSTHMVSFEPHAPGMIELGLVEPLYSLDPDLRQGLRSLLRGRDPESFMRYSDPRGMPEHRAAGAQWVARFGLQVPPEDVLVCSGAQHALACCLSGLFRPGDRIATDALTYPGMKTLAAMHGIRLAPIPMDSQGMIPKGLDAACRRDLIKGLYIMPTVHNPTTLCMGEERRRDIARIAQKFSLLAIEDDAYELTLGSTLPPIAALLPDSSVHIAGMSKSLAAGLRVAFMAAKGPLIDTLARTILNTIWMTPPLNAELASRWILDGTADKTVDRKRTEAKQRYNLAKKYLKKIPYQGHETGFYLWVTLPPPWKAQVFETQARQAGINIFAAEKFAVADTEAPPNIRLSLSGPPTKKDLHAGLTILTQLLKD